MNIYFKKPPEVHTVTAVTAFAPALEVHNMNNRRWNAGGVEPADSTTPNHQPRRG